MYINQKLFRYKHLILYNVSESDRFLFPFFSQFPELSGVFLKFKAPQAFSAELVQ
ncbi:hypothetical protein MmTuc01_0787 [Methanosarcina mazei Tuc01]|uniref:Uncharacterized protein n=1 Tax=Methanosarcina mazei Tuc01 TaxID=1236903 RepID=M1Q1N5_METMZ|nr:hypothetical protein MmTuc01_0787 [Methanosarcina mazei Tuc01]